MKYTYNYARKIKSDNMQISKRKADTQIVLTIDYSITIILIMLT